MWECPSAASLKRYPRTRRGDQLKNILYIFGGLPGTGKSTLAIQLARATGAVYLRIDTIEDALQRVGTSIETGGYEVAYDLAADNLRNGLSVVADSVNPIELTRSAWRNVAVQLDKSFRQIEITCSDKVEHQRRIESRNAQTPGCKVLTWEDVLKRNYELWQNPDVVIDTAAANFDQSRSKLATLLGL